MEQLTANFSGAVRRERLDGRNYLVVPLTMLVPGVLNGSQGPGYYPLEEIVSNYEAWNGMPILDGHPSLNGQSVSGRNPQIWERYGLGYVYNVQVNGKLVGEGWFDLEKTRKVNPSILNALQQGNKVELSTGLSLTPDRATKGQFNSKPYEWVARNHRPDHLAVLINDRGACSLDDGCGVGVANAEGEDAVGLWNRFKSMIENALLGKPSRNPEAEMHSGGTEEECDCGGTCEECKAKAKANNAWSDEARRKALEARRRKGKRAEKEERVGKKSKAVKDDVRMIDAHGHLGRAASEYRFKPLGESSAKRSDGTILQFAQGSSLSDTKHGGWKHLTADGKVLASGQGTDSLRDHLHTDNAWCPTGEGGGRDNTCSSADGGGGSGSGSSGKAKNLKKYSDWRNVQAIFGKNEGLAYIFHETVQGISEGKTPQEAFFDASENQNYYGNRPDIRADRKTVADQIRKYLGVKVDPNKGHEERADNKSRSTSTKETNMLTNEQRESLIGELVTNCDCTGFKAEDREVLNEMEDEQLEKFGTIMAKNKELVTNAAKAPPKAIEMKDLPKDMQEDLIFARNAKQAHKDELIGKLVANISDETVKAAQIARLSTRSLADLEADLVLLPQTMISNSMPLQSYLGQAVPARNAAQIKKPQPLGIPTWNFDKATA